jgi:NTP pyrophosphatase (non-canonical NTP hydrolase)
VNTPPASAAGSGHDDPLRALIASTEAFYARFGVTPTPNDAITNLNEEVFELVQAAMQGDDRTHIAEEAADVFVTAIGVCLATGVPVQALIEQIYAVAAKNDAKTHETHVFRDGKIRRRTLKDSR